MRILIALASLLPFCASAQSWCPVGAEWIYHPPFGWPATGFSRISYTGDTLVGGSMGQRLSSEFAVQYWGDTTTFQSFIPAAYLTSVSGGLVRLWSFTTESWDTLYWFSAQPGDHWRIQTMPWLLSMKS